MPVCVCVSDCLREVHVLRAGERLQRPVDEAVKKDKAGAAGPDHQDADEGGTQIVDHLQVGHRNGQINIPFQCGNSINVSHQDIAFDSIWDGWDKCFGLNQVTTDVADNQ